MSKSDPKSPSRRSHKSAWAKGPPTNTSTALSITSPEIATHSRRSSTPGLDVLCEDGVAGATGSSYMGSDSSAAFGWVDNVAVPMSSSPAAVSSIKSESVGTVLAAPSSVCNGRVTSASTFTSSLLTSFLSAPSASAASSSAPAPKPHPKVDRKKIFQPSTRSSTTTTSPTPMSAGMPSPRMGPPLLLQPVPVPGWPGYYYPYSGMAMDQQYVQYPQQWMPQPVPPKHHPQEVPPDPPMSDMPTSPRAQPAQLHPPGTPTLTSAIPSTGHPPHTTPSPHTHTTSLSNASSPPTPLSTTAPGGGLGRLNSGTSTFVLWKVTIKDGSGLEVDLERFKKAGPVVSPSVMVPSSPAQKTVVGMETPEAKAKRLAEENEKERPKKEAEKAARRAEKNKRKKERKKAEKACLIKEAAQNIEEAKAEVPEESKVEGTGTTGAVPPLPSALATTRAIKDLGSIIYPEGIKCPKAELNVNAKQGKFRYDREFLLQFMDICHQKPHSLSPLDAFSREPADVLRSTGKLETSMPTIAAMTAVSQKDAYEDNTSKSKHDSRRGGEYAQTGPDGWAAIGSSAPRPPPKAGDLSNFGKMSKTASMTLGPSTIFAGKNETTRESHGSVNTFSISSQTPELVEPAASSKSSRPLRQNANIDLGQSGVPEGPVRYPKPNRLPRTVPKSRSDEAHADSAPALSTVNSDDEEWEVASPLMTQAEAEAEVGENSKEFFNVRDINDAEVYFIKLPVGHRWRLINKLVMSAIESKEADAQLVANLFERAVSRDLCSPTSFEQGFQQVAEILDEIAIDAPKAFNLMAIMMKGARLGEERSSRLASKSMDRDKLLSLLASDISQSWIESPLSPRSTFANDARASPQENEPISDSDAHTMVCDDAQELFSLLDLRAEAYFTRLPAHHHWRLVDKLVSTAITNESDARLVAGLFDRAASRRLCAPASFEAGFAPVAQALDYIAMSAPRALDRMAMMMKGAHIHEDHELCERLGGRSQSGGILLSLLVS